MCLQIKYVLSRPVLNPPKKWFHTKTAIRAHIHKQMTHIRKNHNAKSTGLLSKRGMWPVISAQESREGYMLLSEKAEGGRQRRRKKWNEMIKHVFPWRKSGWDCRVIPQLGRMCACACKGLCTFIYGLVCIIVNMVTCVFVLCAWACALYEVSGGTRAFWLLLSGGLN